MKIHKRNLKGGKGIQESLDEHHIYAAIQGPLGPAAGRITLGTIIGIVGLKVYFTVGIAALLCYMCMTGVRRAEQQFLKLEAI